MLRTLRRAHWSGIPLKQSYGASSQEGLPWREFSLPHRKILRPVNIVFDDICPEWPWIAFFAGDFRKLQPYVCHVSCYLTTCNVIESKGFPNSPEVMLFFPARVQIYVLLLPKFSVKHWWMLNGNFKPLLDKCFDWIIPSNKKQTIAFFISFPASRLHIDPTSCPCSPASSPLPLPVLPGSRPPVPLHKWHNHLSLRRTLRLKCFICIITMTETCF